MKAKEKWAKIYEEQRASGLSKVDYCKQNGLNYNTFVVAGSRYKDESLKKAKQCRSATEWDELVSDYLVSGVSAIKFCTRENVSYSTFAKKLSEYGTSTKYGVDTFKRWESYNKNYEKSSLTQKEYCLRENINYHTFKYMRCCIKKKQRIQRIISQYGIQDIEFVVSSIVRQYHSRQGNYVRNRYAVASKHLANWLKENNYIESTV